MTIGQMNEKHLGSRQQEQVLSLIEPWSAGEIAPATAQTNQVIKWKQAR